MKTLASVINDTLKKGIESNKSMTALVSDVIKLGMSKYEASFWVPREVSRLRAEMRRERLVFTFGVEIETSHLSRAAFCTSMRGKGYSAEYQQYNHRDSEVVFKLVTDASIHGSGGDTPLECVTPILKGRLGMDRLKACCDSLSETGAKVNRSCGLHVHIGAKDLTDEQYVSVFVNYLYLEDVIDTFMAPSRRNSTWCQSLRGKRNALLASHTKSDVYYALDGSRYWKVNPVAFSAHRTVEFRQHGGTTDYAKISAWVEFLGRLVQWSKTNRLTSAVTSVHDIPFLTADLKAFFSERAAQFANGAQSA